MVLANNSPHVRESGIRNPRNFSLWNPESSTRESGIQALESGIQFIMESGIHGSENQNWNPESALKKVWNPESRNLESGIQRLGIRNPALGIRNPSYDWIPLHGAI